MAKRAPRSASTRERLIDEAVRLFAQQGYRGTSVAEIEEAAGLKPGNGSLYTHFASKQDLLAAAVQKRLSATRSIYPFFDLLPLGDLRAELRLVSRALFEVMNQWRDLALILMKDREQLGELRNQAEEAQREGYAQFTNWLQTHMKGTSEELDYEVLAAIALGSLSSYWQQTTTMGSSVVEIEKDRFLEGWVETMYRALRPSASHTRSES